MSFFILMINDPFVLRELIKLKITRKFIAVVPRSIMYYPNPDIPKSL